MEIEEQPSVEYEGFVSPTLEYEESLEPIMHDLRFTFSNQDSELKCLQDKQFIGRCKKIWHNLVTHLKDLGYFHKNIYTSGFETMNKDGDQCPAHIHLRFKSVKNTQSMRRTIKRYLTDVYDEDTTGNKSMMFKGKLEKDIDKFYRYPLKQGLKVDLCGGFSKEQLQHMHEVAKDSYQTVIQINQQKIDKKDATDTLFQRVLIKIKKNDVTTKLAIAKIFVETYIEEDRPLNRSVIDGYVLNAMVKLQLTTVEDVLQGWGY